MNKGILDGGWIYIKAQENGSPDTRNKVFEADLPMEVCNTLLGEMEVMGIRGTDKGGFVHLAMLINYPVEKK